MRFASTVQQNFDCGWSSAPDSAGGAFSAPPDRLAGFKGSLRGGKKGGGGRESDKKGREKGRRGEKWTLSLMRSLNRAADWLRPAQVANTYVDRDREARQTDRQRRFRGNSVINSIYRKG